MKRKTVQWGFVAIFCIVICFGWKYPILGFMVPITMGAGIIGALMQGRVVCGNICARGSFYDRVISLIAPKRALPAWMRGWTFRVILMVCLMGFMGFRIMQNPSSWEHWGYTFWVMCVATTVIGVVPSLFLRSRTWCAFCPAGTMQALLGGKKKQLRINTEACIECYQCEKACPMELPIVSFKQEGVMRSPDCIRCSECIAVCPKNALSWPSD